MWLSRRVWLFILLGLLGRCRGGWGKRVVGTGSKLGFTAVGLSKASGLGGVFSSLLRTGANGVGLDFALGDSG